MHESATLPLLLKQLGLPTFYHQWEDLAQRAQTQHWSYAKYLSILADTEVSARYQKRIKRHAKESKLPPGKTLSTFDFRASKSIHQPQIQAVAENTSWIHDAKNVVIFGPSGVGKTHLAAAIGHELITKEIRVLFTSTTTLVQKLQIAKRELKLADALNKLSRYPLLILDDIGYVKKDDGETSVLFELIADRYENKSLLITSNQPFSSWDNIFPDNMMAVAAIDRLVHHAVIINIKDQSYRKRSSEKQFLGNL
jgi:DNA replication protein DnaC